MVLRLKRSALLCAGFVLCSIFGGCVTEETLMLAEDPAFVQGYGDGCQTSGELQKSFSTKTVKDDYAFENSRAYRAGWRQGFAQCKDPVPEAETGGRILGEQSETF
ncbi:MAG: hypothetical protein AAF668_05690 [Pseudomonadota bacterium]